MPTEGTPPKSLSDVRDQSQPTLAAEDLHELLTAEEVAAVLKVSPSWVYEHTRSRGTPRAERLPHNRIGKYVRFDPGAIRAFLERKKCQPK